MKVSYRPFSRRLNCARRRCRLLLGAAGLLASAWVLAQTPVTVEETELAGQRAVAIANEFYKLTLVPERGGRCASFIIKQTGRELVYDGKNGGLFQDHFAHQGYPGELLNAPYTYAIEREGDTAASIKLWVIAVGGKDGRDALTRGLRVEKRITLRAGRHDVEVTNTFVNPTDQGKNVGMWVQQCFCYGGDRLFDLYYRPSTQGIHLAGLNDSGKGPYLPVVDVYSADWVGASKYTDAGGREPVGGWTAGRDRRTNEGAVFLLDYNYLDVLYNCSGSFTTEWFLDKVPLPPHKSWSTTYRVVPVDGFTGFSHADTHVIANTEVVNEPKTTRIRHQFAAVNGSIAQLQVTTTIHGVRSKRDVSLPPLKLHNIGVAPATMEQIWDQPQTEPMVVRIALSGGDWSARYEYYYEGSFAAEGIQGAGEIAEYTVPRPPKQKEFLKPDSWDRPRNDHPRVLVLYGLFSNHYRIEQAVAGLDPQAETVISSNWDTFPPTYDELLGYDLIVLSNVEAGADYAREMVADVVRYGGVGCLVFGGMKTLSGGEWMGTALADMLPATFPPRFGFRWEKQGVFPSQSKHPAAAGVVFEPSARFYWLNELTAKQDAVVAMEAGNRPLLIVGSFGKGRTAVVAGTCFGEAQPGQTEAWTTPAWVELLTGTMRWLNDSEPTEAGK